MKPAIAALVAALLVAVASSVQAQDPAGTTQDTGTATAQPDSAPGKPSPGEQGPKLTPKQLIDTLNLLTRPRPRAGAEPAAVAPAPAEPAAVAGAPVSAAAATPAVVVPRDVKPQPTPILPRAEAAAAPRPTRPVVEPAPTIPVVQPAEPAATSPAAAEPPAPPTAVAASEPIAQAPVAAPKTATPVLGATVWLLLGLLAMAAAAAAVTGLQRARRIARTRAALALKPRLDPAAGAASLGGLALAGPAVAIRARLDGAP